MSGSTGVASRRGTTDRIAKQHEIRVLVFAIHSVPPVGPDAAPFALRSLRCSVVKPFALSLCSL